MKLIISRNQASGMLGKVKFELSAQVELTQAERDITKKYKADKEILLEKEIKIPLTGRSIQLAITIGSLIAGQKFKCNDIAEILEYEKNIKGTGKKVPFNEEADAVASVVHKIILTKIKTYIHFI